MMTGARAVALRTDPTGRRVIGLEIDVDGTRRTVIASTYVVAAGAINSAALLLRSASDRHPNGLANSTGLVGRNYMAHVNSALMAIRPKTNGTVFQKTLALNDWYFGESNSRVGMGHAQLLGKLQAEMLEGAVPWAPNAAPRRARRPERRLVPDDRGSPGSGEPRLARLVRSGHRELPGQQPAAAQAPSSARWRRRCGGPATR